MALQVRIRTLTIPLRVVGVTAALVIGGLQLFPQGSLVSPPAHVGFRNVAKTAGIGFVLENHPTPRKHLIETMPGGVAAFDYDGDGLTDIYFTNGASTPSLVKDSPKYWNRLYRNLGGMKFEDVTERAGVAGRGYSMAVAAADYDNDGHVDLFIAGVGQNILYHNRGDGTFEDVTAKARILSDQWSIGAAWVDYDNDGLLDLFVVNYVKWSPDFDVFCGDPERGIRTYCHPRFFEQTSNTLYRNQGDGTFKDVSNETGISSHPGKGMAVAVADYDLDGFPDLFVTNDKMPNFLFHNLGNGKFEEAALDAGGALLDSGNAISNMGADFRDYDNDGWPDVAITALYGESFPLFRNDGMRRFVDVTYSSRLSPLSRSYSGWGIGMFDLNNDGWKDLFTANAHVNDQVDRFEPTQYRLHNGVFLNRGDGTFVDQSENVGSEFLAPRAHRGAAFADFNNDGKIDVVVTALGEPAELWQNVTPAENTWLIVKLTGTMSNRDGIGARIRLGTQCNHMTTAVGYASSSHFGVHFGTGKLKQIDQIEIQWPSGKRQTLRNVRANQVLQVRE
jgi:enediyne biosynthesis protein E4